MRSSFEDAGALIDHLSPQTDVLVLDLLGCAVHGLGNQATLRYLTLQRKKAHVYIGSVKENSMWVVSCFRINFYSEFKSYSDSHHALSSQEIRNDFLVYVVHETSSTLIVIACVDQELLAGVFINKWAHLREKADIKCMTCL